MRPTTTGNSINLSGICHKEIVPLILRLIPVASVCDIGCGDGTWLRVFRERAVTNIVDIDGEHLTRDLLQIPVSDFQPMDLRHQIIDPAKFLTGRETEVFGASSRPREAL